MKKILTSIFVLVLVSGINAQQKSERITSSDLKYQNGATHEESLKNEINRLEQKLESLKLKQQVSEKSSNGYQSREEEIKDTNVLLAERKKSLKQITEK